MTRNKIYLLMIACQLASSIFITNTWQLLLIYMIYIDIFICFPRCCHLNFIKHRFNNCQENSRQKETRIWLHRHTAIHNRVFKNCGTVNKTSFRKMRVSFCLEFFWQLLNLCLVKFKWQHLIRENLDFFFKTKNK
jgi:hypothetical protein